MLFYLSGAIEYAPDRGTGWRAEITPFLESLGHRVYDPAADHRKNLSEQEARDFRSWKATDLPRFQRTVRKIIAWDLDWIEQKADCILAYWDVYAGRGAGSQAELTVAHRRGIPVYVVRGMLLGEISGWVLGCATEVFADFDEFRAFLRNQQDLAERVGHPSAGTGARLAR